METRANYILVGAFTLAGLLGLVAFALWFAKVEVQRQFGYLDLRFASVSGLTRAAEVRFPGLPVGQVGAVDAVAELGRLGLNEHLSAQRSNGVRAMVERIRLVAADAA